jgi:hypothetical protein
LLHLGRVAATSGQVKDSLQLWVDALRERGVTWARIGAALRMTRQSAWVRWHLLSLGVDVAPAASEPELDPPGL